MSKGYNREWLTALKDRDLIEEYKRSIRIGTDSNIEIEYRKTLKAEIDRRGLKLIKES